MGAWLGAELKRLRALKGYSTRHMAHVVGIPHMSYVTYEQGKAIPPPPRRKAIASALGLSAQALDDLVEDDQYEVFLRSRGLSDAARVAVRDFVREIRERDKKEQAKPRRR